MAVVISLDKVSHSLEHEKQSGKYVDVRLTDVSCKCLQAEMLTSTAMKAGFSGGLVVDFPHSTRAKKYFLVLMVGSSSYQPQAKGINGEDSDNDDQEVQVANRQRSNKRRKTAKGNIQVTLLQASKSMHMDTLHPD